MNHSTPLILFAGDTHSEFGHLEAATDALKPDAIILLGDIQARWPLHDELSRVVNRTEVWWIHGNHDTDTEADYDNLFASELRDRNLHGRVVEIAGVRVAGLGGIFRHKVWMPQNAPLCHTPADLMCQLGAQAQWRGGLPLQHRSTIFPEDFERLAGQRADVLVTHEAPMCHPFGFQAINELGRRLDVKVAFHGHRHDNLDYRACWPMMGFRAYGVGLRGLTDLDGKAIRAGEEDAVNSHIQSRIVC